MKTTQDGPDHTIMSFRLPKKMRLWIREQARAQHRTSSQFLKDLVEGAKGYGR